MPALVPPIVATISPLKPSASLPSISPTVLTDLSLQNHQRPGPSAEVITSIVFGLLMFFIALIPLFRAYRGHGRE